MRWLRLLKPPPPTLQVTVPILEDPWRTAKKCYECVRWNKSSWKLQFCNWRIRKFSLAVAFYTVELRTANRSCDSMQASRCKRSNLLYSFELPRQLIQKLYLTFWHWVIRAWHQPARYRIHTYTYHRETRISKLWDSSRLIKAKVLRLR